MSETFARDLVALLPRLRRFAASLTGNAEEANDLVQAACERALKAQEQWQEGTRLDAWVFRIIRNLWIDQIRKRKAEGPTTDIEAAFEVSGDDGRRVTDARLAIGAVEAELARMPAEQREVILLVCYEQLSYREAADRLGIPIGTVMSRLARGRQALVTALGLHDEVTQVSEAGR